jgi:hypothetical protein
MWLLFNNAAWPCGPLLRAENETLAIDEACLADWKVGDAAVAYLVRHLDVYRSPVIHSPLIRTFSVIVTQTQRSANAMAV